MSIEEERSNEEEDSCEDTESEEDDSKYNILMMSPMLLSMGNFV